MECIMSVLDDKEGNSFDAMMKADGFAVQYTGLRPVGSRGDVPERFRDRVLHLQSWKDIARKCGSFSVKLVLRLALHRQSILT
eukprot:3514643-Pyramimonas_sp.AAC.1